MESYRVANLQVCIAQKIFIHQTFSGFFRQPAFHNRNLIKILLHAQHMDNLFIVSNRAKHVFAVSAFYSFNSRYLSNRFDIRFGKSHGSHYLQIHQL